MCERDEGAAVLRGVGFTAGAKRDIDMRDAPSGTGVGASFYFIKRWLHLITTCWNSRRTI
ncbi:hypothetical protein PLACP1_04580 [Planifilum fimeticola]